MAKTSTSFESLTPCLEFMNRPFPSQNQRIPPKPVGISLPHTALSTLNFKEPCDRSDKATLFFYLGQTTFQTSTQSQIMSSRFTYENFLFCANLRITNKLDHQPEKKRPWKFYCFFTFIFFYFLFFWKVILLFLSFQTNQRTAKGINHPQPTWNTTQLDEMIPKMQSKLTMKEKVVNCLFLSATKYASVSNILWI